VSDTNQTALLERRTRVLLIAYAVLCLLPAIGGVLLSLTAQPGGISAPNAFLAPFFGPWSQALAPNPHPPDTWSPPYTAFARCLAITLAFSLVGSLLVPRGWLRTLATLIAVPTLILWLLTGLMKVVSQLA